MGAWGVSGLLGVWLAAGRETTGRCARPGPCPCARASRGPSAVVLRARLDGARRGALPRAVPWDVGRGASWASEPRRRRRRSTDRPLERTIEWPTLRRHAQPVRLTTRVPVCRLASVRSTRSCRGTPARSRPCRDRAEHMLRSPSTPRTGGTARGGTRAPDPSATLTGGTTRTGARAPDPGTALTGGSTRTGTPRAGSRVGRSPAARRRPGHALPTSRRSLRTKTSRTLRVSLPAHLNSRGRSSSRWPSSASSPWTAFASPRPRVPSSRPFWPSPAARGISAVSDARLSGLGWTEALILDHGLAAPRWAVAGRWAPPALSVRPAPVGLAGPVVSDGLDGAVSAPRGAWRASGVLGGPLSAGRLGAVLSLEASGVGLPATEPGLAGGGRSRRASRSPSAGPGTSDRLSLLVLAGRRTESPDCFRCTESAARLDRELALLAGNRLGPRGRPRRRPRAPPLPRAPERRRRSPGADGRAQPPGPLAVDHRRCTRPARRGRRREHPRGGPEPRPPRWSCPWRALGLQRLEGGVEAWLDAGHRALSLPGAARFLDHGPGCPDRRGAGLQPTAFEVDALDTAPGGWTLAAHLADSLRLGDLTVRLGVRLEAAQASAGESTTGLRLGLGPRLALAWNVGGEGRHWILAHAGRSHQPDLLAVTTRAVLPRERVMAWSDGGFDACARPGPACVQLGGVATLAPGGLPRIDEVAPRMAGAPRARPRGRVRGRWRRTSGLWTEEETGLLTDPEGQWTSKDGAWTSRRTLASDERAWRQSLALGVWARAHTGPARVSLAWSLARSTGTAAGPFDPWLADARTAALAAGPLPDDQRHRVTVTLAPARPPRGRAGRTPAIRHRRSALGDLRRAGFGRAPDGAADAGHRHARLRPGGTERPGRVHRRCVDPPQAGHPVARCPAPARSHPRGGAGAGGNTPVHLSASSARLGAVLRREPPFQLVLGVRAGQ
jgi:hypothetical protein